MLAGPVHLPSVVGRTSPRRQRVADSTEDTVLHFAQGFILGAVVVLTVWRYVQGRS